jgi:glycosyltransferase involved in cell wall biosynthesis
LPDGSERTRVLLLLPTVAGGGAERFFCILLRHLDRTSFDPHLALFERRGEYLSDVPPDVTVHDLKCSRARYVLWRLVRLVWRLRPQVVVSTLPQTNVALAMSKLFLPRGVRVVLCEPNIASATFADHEVPNRRMWAWLYRIFCKHADQVVCLSESIIDDMARNFGVPRKKHIRIYYPVDLELVRKLGDTAQNPYGGPGPHLAAAGRLCWQKGFDVLLAAMPAVLDQFPQARLTILGQGPLLAELTARAQQLGLSDAVCFAGFQQNPWSYLKYADAFVLSSRYEGLPNILLEALALGSPIVATDCPGAIREVQARHPEIILVPPENPDALAAAMIDLCKTRRAQNWLPGSLQPFAQNLSEFSLPQVIGEYSKLLSS